MDNSEFLVLSVRDSKEMAEALGTFGEDVNKQIYSTQNFSPMQAYVARLTGRILIAIAWILFEILMQVKEIREERKKVWVELR